VEGGYGQGGEYEVEVGGGRESGAVQGASDVGMNRIAWVVYVLLLHSKSTGLDGRYGR